MINEIYESSFKKAGYRRIQMKLLEQGIVMNHKKIVRITKKYGIQSRVRRRTYRNIFKKNESHRTHPNLLNRKFTTNTPDKYLCTDITYLHYGHGKTTYLSAVKDICTKEVVSWQVSSNMALGFVMRTIEDLKGISET